MKLASDDPAEVGEVFELLRGGVGARTGIEEVGVSGEEG